MDAITLRGMRFHTLVGLLPHEGKFPQPLELDVTAFLSLRRVGEADAPAMRLDYRTLYQTVADCVGTSHHKLLEGLCESIEVARVARQPVNADDRLRSVLATPFVVSDVMKTASRQTQKAFLDQDAKDSV